MKKAIWILIFVCLAAGLASGVFFQRRAAENSRRAFLKNLRGEVVFSRRDKNGVLNIWKIRANGTGEKLLYHNEGNRNAYLPFWGIERKIYFTIFYRNEARKASMDSNGKNVEILEDKGFFVSRESRAKDIVIQKGSVYWKDEKGGLHKVFYFPHQNYKTNPGASEASWSPDKKYIIFDVCSFFKDCRIMIAAKDGSRIAELTKGQEPDWKY